MSASPLSLAPPYSQLVAADSKRAGKGHGGGSNGHGSGGKGHGGGGKGHGGGSRVHVAGGRGPSPALLTANIKKAASLSELFTHIIRHHHLLNHIHLSACWSALGLLARASAPGWDAEHADGLQLLRKQTAAVVLNEHTIRARELANIAHGVVKSGQAKPDDELMDTLAAAICPRLRDCNSQELANIAWAFAKAGNSDAHLFSILARAAENRLHSFNGQEVANFAWAFATAGHSDKALFTMLTQTVQKRLADFTAQGLSNLMWAFVKVDLVDAQLFKAMAQVTKDRISSFTAQDLAHTAWAFSTAGIFDTELFERVAGATKRQLSAFTSQGLANTIWGLAKAGHVDADLFAALASAAERRIGEFNSQDVATTAWSFAKVCHLNPIFFDALASRAEQCIDDFNLQDLINTAHAFAKIGHNSARLFAAVARSLAKRKLNQLTAVHVANVAWAFAKAGQVDQQLFLSLARSASTRVSEFTAREIADVAWSFAGAGQLDGHLFSSLAQAAEELLESFTEDELDNAEWAFNQAGQAKIVRSLRQRRKRTASAAASLAAAGVDVSKCGRIVIAGGGIGGAAAALALESRGFEVVVLESDVSFEARKQGYGLTIQRQDAIQALGINLAQDDAPSTSHYTFSAGGDILGFYGERFGARSKVRAEAENSGRFIHIPRQVLRRRLVERIRPGTIRWGAKLQSFVCSSSDERGCTANGVTVTLTDGSTIDAALLVGSDGIFSTVRQQLKFPNDRLNYVGLVVVLGIVESATPLAERRIFETVDGTTRIYAMPFTTESTMWQLSFPYPEDGARSLCKDPVSLKEEIVRRCLSWHDPVPALLKGTPLNCMSGYPVYDREPLEPGVLRTPSQKSAKVKSSASRLVSASIMHQQQASSMPHVEPPSRQRRVTLMGDAAHPMTPFRAQGANQALSDAVLLADSLVEGIRIHGPDAGIDAALPLFEQKMLNRCVRSVIGSREKAKELHSKLALQPARKVQREFGVDMPKAIRDLRAHKIGAHSATDPRGLDDVVAQVIEGGDGRVLEPPSHTAAISADMKTVNKGKRKASADATTDKEKKVIRSTGECGASGEGGGDDHGFSWQKVIGKRVEDAAEGGVPRKKLRKEVVRLYLEHIKQRTCHRPEGTGQVELKARFRCELRQMKKKGDVHIRGKRVHRHQLSR